MNSIGLSAALLLGSVSGLYILSRYPSGLEHGPGYALVALGLLCLLPAMLARGSERTRWTALLAMVALIGCGLALLTHPPVTPSHLAYYNGSERVSITGTIAGEPVYGDRWQRLRISADSIRLAGSISPQHISGDMYVVLPRYPAFSVGERLALSGRLTDPPRFGSFDYPAYLARQGVYSYMSYPRASSLGPGAPDGLTRHLADARSNVRATLRRHIPEPQAALVVGIVTGDRTSIPPDVYEAYRRSGTLHILAISGQNISLLVGTVYLFFAGREGRRRMPVWLVVAVLALLAAYTAFTGATPSVVRAAIMGGILLLAPVVGRRYDPVAALAASAGLMTLHDLDTPADLGFQLSFAAMLGISLLSPHLVHLLQRARVPTLLAAPLSASLGAQAATAPIIALATWRVSLVSPLATLTADIALLPSMAAGILAGIAGVLLPFAEWLIVPLLGLLAWLFTSWMLWWVQSWASLPWASVDLEPFSPAWVALYYGVLGVALWLADRRRRGKLLLPNMHLVLAALALLVWLGVLLLLFAA